MATKFKFKFDPNQDHQQRAIQSVLNIFQGMPENPVTYQFGDEIIPNLPPDHMLAEDWLFDNLREVQKTNKIIQNTLLDVDDGLLIDGIPINTWRYPLFTIEMETGTGKTYVYLRTIHELKKHFGFRKFIIIVPSIAIYQGVIKNFQVTREHFKSLYGNETVGFTQYDGQQIAQLRQFATSGFLEIMVMTIDSFNKVSNIIYKPTEKLPGERLPYQFIQETRPILILDESQNYTSEKSKAALRTLNPLFAIKYSATPRERLNTVYHLSPFDAFQENLVKKIEVFGVEDTDSPAFGRIALQAIDKKKLSAKVATPVSEKGIIKKAEITLKHKDDLYAKTKFEPYKDAGWIVTEINSKSGFILFENTTRLILDDHAQLTLTKAEIFRIQIEQTVKQHLIRQKQLNPKGIKVLSLFFIDRVANYTGPDALIPKLFDAAFNKFIPDFPEFRHRNPKEVREAYFAAKKTKSGQDEFIDTEGRNQTERELEKAAFELIMKKKERLLEFDEKVSFIFAHSALKEGWDNPNVFQICTLKDTISETRKRQEIGRGLRLAVNQDGDRVLDDQVNILTVIANDSYEEFVAQLQSEYRETGDIAPPKPTNASKSTVNRDNNIYKSKEFQEFWQKLNRKTSYKITIDDQQFIQDAINKLNSENFPQPRITVTKGKFAITTISLTLKSINQDKARIRLEITDTLGLENITTNSYDHRTDLAKIAKDDRLKGFRILTINQSAEDPFVEFDNGVIIRLNETHTFQSEKGQHIDSRTFEEAEASYPVFNLIDRAAKATELTRPTVLSIFKGLKEEKKSFIFKNPEGFAGKFITIIREELADHIAKRIEYEFDGQALYEAETIFPETRRTPQKELIPGNKTDKENHSLYDQVQIDSEIEKEFVEQRLHDDKHLIFFFKFPLLFKIDVPKIIGNYNPDWGIVRFSEDKTFRLELVRETKGNIDLKKLQFSNEERKILCAHKHFQKLGIDYRHLDVKNVPRYWEKDSNFSTSSPSGDQP